VSLCEESEDCAVADWVRIATMEQCPPGSATEWVAGDRLVALFNVEGTLYALDGICPHQGGPLGKGLLEGHVVTCPWHGWQYDVRSGEHEVNPALRHTSLDVKVEGEFVCVRLPDVVEQEGQ